MLHVKIPPTEFFNEATGEFITFKGTTLQMEHSLVSISKWEQKWHKAFLTQKEKTDEEIRDYIKCMTITQNVDPVAYQALTPENYKEINDYINDPMTATYFREDPIKRHSNEVITNELIYYWMVSLNIPVEFQKWHINHLMTLIRVCSIKNAPAKKMSSKDVMGQYRSLNQARRKAMNTKG